jgi:hypothetical protein
MNNELLEKLAAIEHEQWKEWSESVAPEVSEERKARWETYWVPYDQLDEKTKDLDREWAMEVMEVIEPYLAGEEAGAGEGADGISEDELADLVDMVEPEEEIVEVEEEPEDIKAQSHKAKEMVMKVNVDASKFPNLARFLQANMEFPAVEAEIAESADKLEGHCFATWMEGVKKLEEAQSVFNQAMQMAATEELPLDMKEQLSGLIASVYSLQTQIEATLTDLKEVDPGQEGPAPEPEAEEPVEEPAAE